MEDRRARVEANKAKFASPEPAPGMIKEYTGNESPAPQPEADATPVEEAAAPVESEEEDYSDEKIAEAMKEDKVPRPALKSERRKRQKAEKVVATMQEQLAALAEQNRQYVEYIQQMQRQPALTEKEPEKPAIKRPESALDEEALDYVDQRIASLEEQLKKTGATAEERAAALETQAQQAAAMQQVAVQRAKFEAEHPDYVQAYQHVMSAQYATYEERALALGYPEESAKQIALEALQKEVATEAMALLKAGRNLPETYYQRAKRMGYTPKEKAPAPGTPNLEAIKRNQGRTATPSGGEGVPLGASAARLDRSKLAEMRGENGLVDRAKAREAFLRRIGRA